LLKVWGVVKAAPLTCSNVAAKREAKMQTEELKCPNHPTLVYRREIGGDAHIYFRSAFPIITTDEEGKTHHTTGWLSPCSCDRQKFIASN
jgi:hypothetical protein